MRLGTEIFLGGKTGSFGNWIWLKISLMLCCVLGSIRRRWMCGFGRVVRVGTI